MHIRITAHTTSGDQEHEVFGDLAAGRSAIHTYVLREYPGATFDETTVTDEGDPQ